MIRTRLRRAALGVIRTVLDAQLSVSLRKHLMFAPPCAQSVQATSALVVYSIARPTASTRDAPGFPKHQLTFLIFSNFFADRLKVALREQGVRHDLIDAVFALGGEDDLVRLVRRVEALQAFLKTDDGANLLVGYRRARTSSRSKRRRTSASIAMRPIQRRSGAGRREGASNRARYRRRTPSPSCSSAKTSPAP